MRLWVVALGLWLLAPAFGSEKKPAPKESAARKLFLARCSTCHDPGRVYHRRAGRDEWREIVDRMRRMPQSGISPADARVITDYLATLERRDGKKKATTRLGGRKAFGRDWLSILEIATVRNDSVRLGGRTYKVQRRGLGAVVSRGRKNRLVSLTPQGKPDQTAVADEWKIGAVRYEVHLVLYEIRGDRLRLARALKKLP